MLALRSETMPQSYLVFCWGAWRLVWGSCFFHAGSQPENGTLVLFCYTWGEPRWHFEIVAISSNFSEKCVSCLECLTCIDVSWYHLASICSPLEFLWPCGAQISSTANTYRRLGMSNSSLRISKRTCKAWEWGSWFIKHGDDWVLKAFQSVLMWHRG